MSTTALLLALFAMSTELTPLVADLQSSEAKRRVAAAEGLARLGEEAQGAAVPLAAACGDVEQEVRDWATAALEGLGIPAEADVAALAKLLADDQNADIGYWSATLLGRLEDAAAEAVPTLATAVETHPAIQVRERAAWALGKIGPAAGTAGDALRSASQSTHKRLAKLAGEALAKVAAK